MFTNYELLEKFKKLLDNQSVSDVIVLCLSTLDTLGEQFPQTHPMLSDAFEQLLTKYYVPRDVVTVH